MDNHIWYCIVVRPNLAFVWQSDSSYWRIRLCKVFYPRAQFVHRWLDSSIFVLTALVHSAWLCLAKDWAAPTIGPGLTEDVPPALLCTGATRHAARVPRLPVRNQASWVTGRGRRVEWDKCRETERQRETEGDRERECSKERRTPVCGVTVPTTGRNNWISEVQCPDNGSSVDRQLFFCMQVNSHTRTEWVFFHRSKTDVERCRADSFPDGCLST